MKQKENDNQIWRKTLSFVAAVLFAALLVGHAYTAFGQQAPTFVSAYDRGFNAPDGSYFVSLLPNPDRAFANQTGTTFYANDYPPGKSNPLNGTANDATTLYDSSPDLIISKTHTDTFQQGHSFESYTIIVSNTGGSPTSGTVTVTDMLPAGLTATSFHGTGWACDLPTLTCTRSDALAPNSSYPEIDLFVKVANNAPSNLTNTASVSGGGESNTSNDTASDATTINPCVSNPIVANNTDSGAGSLRQAIKDACDGGTITFASNVRGTITTAGLGNYGNLTIQGPGATLLTISGNNANTVFQAGGGTLTLRGLTIANGKAPLSGYAGGIDNSFRGTVTVDNCIISGNLGNNGNANAGGIYNDGTVTIVNSTIYGNNGGLGRSDASAGGILNQGVMTITNSTISGNTTYADGSGGINNYYGTLTIANSTISGNAGSTGNSGCGSISSVGKDGNLPLCDTAGQDGGIRNTSGGTVTVKNSIIAGNSAKPRLGGSGSPDVIGTFTSQGYNLIGKSDGSTGFTNGTNGDQVGTIATPLDPHLAPLGDYGGTTYTHAPFISSAAIDAADPNNYPATDQRGTARPYNTRADIGAVEYTASSLPVQSGTPNQSYNLTLIPNSGTTTYTLSGGGLPPGLNLVTNGNVVAITGTPTAGGTYNFSITGTSGADTETTNYSISILSPTAAAVSIGGRVLTAMSRGIRNARVSLTDASGRSRIALTNPFGFYYFDDVQPGETYILNVSAKHYNFRNSPQVLFVDEEIRNEDFIALPQVETNFSGLGGGRPETVIASH